MVLLLFIIYLISLLLLIFLFITRSETLSEITKVNDELSLAAVQDTLTLSTDIFNYGMELKSSYTVLLSLLNSIGSVMSVKFATVTDDNRRRLLYTNNFVLLDLDTTLQTFAAYIAEGMVEGNTHNHILNTKNSKTYNLLGQTPVESIQNDYRIAIYAPILSSNDNSSIIASIPSSALEEHFQVSKDSLSFAIKNCVSKMKFSITSTKLQYFQNASYYQVTII